MVTPVDVAQGQLDIAARRAGELALDIAVHRADVTDLSDFQDAGFDHVCAGGHVAVWVSDLARYDAEAARVLRPDGLPIVNEHHPFRRIRRAEGGGLAVATPYGVRRRMIWDGRGISGAEGLDHVGVRLGGAFVVVRAPGVRRLSLDPGSLGEGGLAAGEVDVGQGEVAPTSRGAGRGCRLR